MIEFLKRHRLLQAVLGGTAAVGAGAAAGQAAIGNDSSTPPKKVPLGQPTKLDIEGTPVQVPPTAQAPPQPPPVALDHPASNAADESTPATPDTTAVTASPNTTANTVSVNTTANTANTVSADDVDQVDHSGPGPSGRDGGDHSGLSGGDHSGPSGDDGGGDHSDPDGGDDGGGHSGSGGSGSDGGGTSGSGGGGGD